MKESEEFNVEECLKHYGILGMKWGKRKGTVTATKRRMSNKELQARIKRLRLEQEYNRLNETPKKTKTSIDKIAKTAGTIVTLTGTALTLYNNINGLASAAKKINSAVKAVK